MNLSEEWLERQEKTHATLMELVEEDKRKARAEGFKAGQEDMREWAALIMEWERPIASDEIVEHIGGWPRSETCNKPNSRASKRAATIRALPILDEEA